MNKETIERAAEEYVMGNSASYVECFEEGARWRINAVWHSPEEEPKADECIIVEKELFEGRYSYDCWKIDSGCAWDKESDYFCVTRWAYVRDLVPDTGKEAAL